MEVYLVDVGQGTSNVICLGGRRAIVRTQITSKCCPDPEAVRPGLLPLQMPGRSSPDRAPTTSGNRTDVACAGTVAVEITAATVPIRRLQTHQAAVDALKASPPESRCVADQARRGLIRWYAN